MPRIKGFPVWLRLLVALLAVVVVSGGAAAPAAARPFAPDVIVTLRPDPGIYVTPGSVLTYEIRAAKMSRGTAYRIRISLPYDPGQLTLLGSSFTDDRDWVRTRTSGEVEVFLGSTGPTRLRVARLTFRVNEQLPENTVIAVRAAYSWEGGDNARSNWAPVLVGSDAVHDPHVWVGVTPGSAPRGALMRFYSDRFVPGEAIALWLNTPDGVQPISRRIEADSEGVVRYDLQTGGLRPGAYSLVLSGISSGLVGVGGFVVE